jgi:hypothetical protein
MTFVEAEVGGINQALEFPFFGGSVSVDTAASFVYPVTVDGVGYLLDTREQKLTFRSVPIQRGAFDDKDSPSRGTLNPESFWGRTIESWHVGAGQTHFDRREDSNPYRFRRSRGVDVFSSRYQVSMLNDVATKRTGSSNIRLATAGSFLYAIDGTTLQRTPDLTAYTSITGVPVTAPTVIASDGFNVLTVHGASGIYKTTRGAATTASHITGTVAQVAYGKGRWIASNDAVLYDITTKVAGAGPVAIAGSELYTHPNSDFDWTCFAEGPSAFYAAGYSGDKSLIYRLTMKEDGTGLNQPVVAGFLPDGELIESMQGYVGFVLLGTSKGVRVAVTGGNGDMTVGALIPTDTTVRCFEGQDRFVWFGWSNFEGAYHGLGRIDLQTFSDTENLAPAYASDLMGTGAGTVHSVVTFGDLRVFAVDVGGGVGRIVAENTAQLTADGEIDSGLFDYGLGDEKLSLYVSMNHIQVDGGDHHVYISVDRRDFTILEGSDHDHIPTGEARGHEFELRLMMERDAVNPAIGPIIASWALRVQPVPSVTEVIEAPLLIVPNERLSNGRSRSADARAKAQHIKTLCGTKEVVLLTVGEQAYTVLVQDYQRAVVEAYTEGQIPLAENSTCLTQFKVVS